jgi:glycine/serine hydroxymethyltransferase
MRFSLSSEVAKPLLTRYAGGEATRRYYQDAAIRAVLEKLARGDKRALLTLDTSSAPRKAEGGFRRKNATCRTEGWQFGLC